MRFRSSEDRESLTRAHKHLRPLSVPFVVATAWESYLQAVKVHILVSHPIVPGSPNHLHEGPLSVDDCILQLLRVTGAEEDVEVQAFFAVQLPRLHVPPALVQGLAPSHVGAQS